MRSRRVRSRFSPMLENLDLRIAPTVWAPPPPVVMELGPEVSGEPAPTTMTYPGSIDELSGPPAAQ